MRKLSSIEKDVVTWICRTEYTFSGLLEDHLNDKILIINKEKNFVDVGFKEEKIPNEKDGPAILGVIDLIENIATVLNFLNYLEANYYIFKTKLAHFDPSSQIVGSDENLKLYKEKPETFTLYRFPDPSLEYEIIQIVEKFFFSTQGLKEYYNNSFQTPEQKHQTINRRLTIIAIIVSLFIGLSSIAINIFFQLQKETSDQKQIENLLPRTDSLNNKINIPSCDSINSILKE
jgi:hypothetical protein